MRERLRSYAVTLLSTRKNREVIDYIKSVRNICNQRNCVTLIFFGGFLSL